ncbi:RNA polymerase sigma factor [Alteribacillus sp. HJP-4]|uniref:RNA polymerase sigma factor n=1 Tax=Alteribacillus sp. HJP-4 TaxID=2775394 RepID=UPI0035CD0A46
MSDNELASRARDGDDAAFQELIERHYRTVQRFAFQIGVKPMDVEDVTQEVFLKVYRSIHTFARGKFTTWLYSVTLNAARDMARKEKRQQRNLLKIQEESAHTSFAAFESNEEAWELHDMITGLKEKYRIPIILHYFHDLSYAEIGAVLGCTEAAVKTRMLRSKKKLKDSLEKVGVVHE